jgi:hypothetical protein
MKDRLFLLGFAGLLLSCGPSAQSPAPAVEYSGCWAVSYPGPVCAPYPEPDSYLKLWVKVDPGTEVEIRAGERLLSAQGEESQGGRRFHLAVPPGLSPLTVRLRQPDGALGPSWSLALVRPEVPAWWRDRGNRVLVRKGVPRKEQGLLLYTLASLALLNGQDAEAVAFLKEGLSVIRAEGRLSGAGGEVETAAMLAWIHLKHFRFTEARRALAELRIPAGAPADARYLLAYNRGLLAFSVGDYRSALEQLRKAVDLAERVGMARYRLDAQQVLAGVFQGLGRSREAAELIERLPEDLYEEKPCDIGSLWSNQGWARFLAREAGEEAEDPTPLLQEARDLFDREGCRPDQKLNARINLALAHQQAHRWREAGKALEEIRPRTSEATLNQLFWWLDLEGREAIAENDPARALRFYRELSERAGRTRSLDSSFRAAVGSARARLLLGDRTAAIEDLATADRLVDEQTWLIPADQGRDTFIAQREQAAQLYLQLLLDNGQLQDAFALARRARSRLLRQLEVRDRLAQLTPAEQERWDQAMSRYWKLRDAVDRQAAGEWKLSRDQVERAQQDRAAQLDEARKDLDAAMADLGMSGHQGENNLTPPGSNEIILAYHPLPQGWVGFAAHPGGVEATRFTLPPEVLGDPAALSRRLLVPFRSLLDAAERLRVLPYGPLRAVDFHALPLDGEPLIARHLVVYSLDLPSRSSIALPDRPVALLVTDPEGNLPEARQEAEAVDAAIRGWRGSWSLRRLDGLAATAGEVLKDLPDADLFHFAGHGNFAGFAGWDSALRLADGSRLTLADLLALRRVPSWVVLSSCEAGQSSAQARGEGMGLAQAFLVAGSRAVIAATERVEDRTSRALVDELYRGWEPGADLPRQLQRAQLVLRQRDPAAWASFRLFEP